MESLDFEANPWLALAIVLLCLALSAFFSGAETALTAASRARMHALEQANDARARIVNRLLQSRERLIGAMLIGNSVVNIGASAFTTSVLVSLFGPEGVIYATIGMSILVIVFSEVMPKTVAINKPDQAALLLARPVSWVVALLGPVTLAIEAFVRVVLRLFRIDINENQSVLSASDEIRGTVDLLQREGSVEKEAGRMFGGILDLEDLEVSDVMIHRTKLRTISADLSSEEIVREILSSPYTRLPLWSGSPENIVGVLHAKDLLRALDTTSLPDQLKAFLTRKTHFALVVDEYGEVMGLVTLEDILEEIVGDIKDEHDLTVQGVRPHPDGSVSVDGSVPVRDLNRAMDWALPDEEATTIAGLVIHEAQIIPDAGQIFTFHGYRFQVLRKSRNRITALRITPVARIPAKP